jgi:hypothetical protein
MVIPALKDADGDYWIAYGADAASFICLTSGGYVNPGATAYPSDEFGPFERTHLEIEETPGGAGCEHCTTRT